MRGSRGEEEMESMGNERLVLLSCACRGGEREGKNGRRRERGRKGENGRRREAEGGRGNENKNDNKNKKEFVSPVESESSDGHQAQLWKGKWKLMLQEGREEELP